MSLGFGAGPDHGSAAGVPQVSGALAAMVVKYVRSRAGETGVLQVLSQAGEHRPVQQVIDPACWSTEAQILSLIEAGARVLGDNDIALHIGEDMLRRYQNTHVADLLRSLGSPANLLRHVTGAVDRLATIYTVEPIAVDEQSATVRSVTEPGIERSRLFCRFTTGLLSSVPVVFGLPPAVVIETECQANHGRFCLFEIKWGPEQPRPPLRRPEPQVQPEPEAPQPTSGTQTGWNSGNRQPFRLNASWEPEPQPQQPPPGRDQGARIAALDRQVERLTTRLEGAYSTAADLIAAENVDSALTRIAARAAHAVNAPQYLLMIQVTPDEPYRLRHFGLTGEEADDLADQLHGGVPRYDPGSMLVVEIASGLRRYGQFAALYQHAIPNLQREQEMLADFADYAATALDVVTALDEARRSNALTNALLSFSRDLSRIGTVDEVAKRLVDTVPLVVGANRATAMFWDEATETLTVRAASEINRKPISEGSHGAGDQGAKYSGNQYLSAPRIISKAPDPAGTTEKPREPVVVHRSDTPYFDMFMNSRDVVVLDLQTDDPVVRRLLKETGTEAAMIAPMFAGEEFLGLVSANFEHTENLRLHQDRDRQERLEGLADQAATAINNARLLEQISHMAWHDSLTGLPNRRLLEDRVNQELYRSRRSGAMPCIFFVDLDHFKEVNDTFGHAAGDVIIQQVAARLSEAVRKQDTVARLGGDEFAVLLPGLTDPHAIEHLARRSLDVLCRPYHVGTNQIEVSGSIGVAVAPANGTTYEELLTTADAAMYNSKSAGRNTFKIVEVGGGGQAQTESSLQTDLRHAIERGELFLVYLPFIELQTDRVVGVEALVRWQHPTRGLLEPGAFIPLAEKSDLLSQIDSWAVREACMQVRRWADSGLPKLRVACNVSAQDLGSRQFIDAVTRAIAHHRIDKGQLELEITERVVLQNTGEVQAAVEELGSIGVRFSIDDFGTGVSTMSRISAFPASTLKIDRSVIKNIGKGGSTTPLVSAIIAMARRMGVDCVAEGVETADQGRVLMQGGCELGQGRLFGEPLGAVDMSRAIASGTN